jgi:hypothetical protein
MPCLLNKLHSSLITVFPTAAKGVGKVGDRLGPHVCSISMVEIFLIQWMKVSVWLCTKSAMMYHSKSFG